MIVSAVSLIASVTLMVYFASRRPDGVHMAYAHMATAALVAIGFAAAFIARNNQMRAGGASESAVAANTSRYTGYVAGWGAVCLLTTYATGVMYWREWVTFTIACAVLAALSLLFASMLQKDADAGKTDAGLLKMASGLAIALLVGMIIAIAGFIIDGKMVRFMTPRFTDWPANNVFFFGAIALAAIAGHALRTKGK